MADEWVVGQDSMPGWAVDMVKSGMVRYVSGIGWVLLIDGASVLRGGGATSVDVIWTGSSFKKVVDDNS